MMVVITEDKAKVLALDAFQWWPGFQKKSVDLFWILIVIYDL